MTTGYLWDRAYLGHNTSPAHPERPEQRKENQQS